MEARTRRPSEGHFAAGNASPGAHGCGWMRFLDMFKLDSWMFNGCKFGWMDGCMDVDRLMDV